LFRISVARNTKGPSPPPYCVFIAFHRSVNSTFTYSVLVSMQPAFVENTPSFANRQMYLPDFYIIYQQLYRFIPKMSIFKLRNCRYFSTGFWSETIQFYLIYYRSHNICNWSSGLKTMILVCRAKNCRL
jgi:hypothetical protein